MIETKYKLNKDDRKVLDSFFGAEFGSYMTMYAPAKTVISIRNISETLGWTRYRVEKAIKSLKEQRLIERASVGMPAVYSYGEYTELVNGAHPPINGFSITGDCHETEMYKKAYRNWEKSLAEWAGTRLNIIKEQ